MPVTSRIRAFRGTTGESTVSAAPVVKKLLKRSIPINQPIALAGILDCGRVTHFMNS